MAASKPVEETVEVELAEAEKEKSNRLSVEVKVLVGDNGDTEIKTMHFRSLTLVPLGILRHTRKNSSEQMWAIFEWALAPEDLEILDQVPSSELDSMLIAMQKASGTKPGES